VTDLANPTAAEKLPSERSVLIVEDDRSFLQRLAKALEQRGFTVSTAESVADGLLMVQQVAPAFVIIKNHIGPQDPLGKHDTLHGCVEPTHDGPQLEQNLATVRFSKPQLGALARRGRHG